MFVVVRIISCSKGSCIRQAFILMTECSLNEGLAKGTYLSIGQETCLPNSVFSLESWTVYSDDC